MQITRQTGQVQTPSIGADDREIVYLSDSGGHGNLWVVNTETGASRQITFEQDPGVGVGVPVWSPDGRHIAFYSTRNGVGGNLLVNPDGGNLRQVIPNGGWAAWSPDSQWLYYNENVQSTSAIGALKKIRPEGGEPVAVRDDKGNRSALSPDGATLYYVIERPAVSGGADYEIRIASPETAPSRVLARIPAQRIPLWQLVHPVRVAGWQLARAAIDRWLLNEHLGAADGGRAVAPADRFRPASDLHRAPGGVGD